MEILALLVRTVVMYICVTVAMRFMGKRQVGELSTAEVSVALIISEVAAMPISNDDVPILHGIIAIAVLVLLEFLLSYLDLKFSVVTKITHGKPSVVIRNGVLQEDVLRKARLTISELNEELRLKNTSIKDVFMAIIETNGQLSIIPTNGAGGVTRDDLKVNVTQDPIDFAIIIDGEIKEQNLEFIGKDETFIKQVLTQKKVMDIKEVLVMYADTKGVTYFQRKNLS